MLRFSYKLRLTYFKSSLKVTTDCHGDYLLALLLALHHFELVHLLELGDLEGAVRLAGLHLKIVNFHVSLSDKIFLIELLSKDGA